MYERIMYMYVHVTRVEISHQNFLGQTSVIDLYIDLFGDCIPKVQEQYPCSYVHVKFFVDHNAQAKHIRLDQSWLLGAIGVANRGAGP